MGPGHKWLLRLDSVYYRKVGGAGFLTNMKAPPTDSRSKSTTVTELIKKLRKYEEIGTIASVRIEFADGSTYDDTPLEHRVMQTAIACNLNAIGQEDLHRYKDLFRRIQTAITDRRELADGYVFRLNGESLSLPDLAEWISLERLCCPFLTFQLQTKGGEPDCWLTLQGPDGAKAIIDQEFAATRHTSTHSSE
jgi:hypothetical protein